MANVINVAKRPDGKYNVTYDDRTTAVLSAKDATAQGININKVAPDVTGQTSFSSSSTNNAFNTSNTPSGTVRFNGKDISVADAIAQSNNPESLGFIRKKLLATGQLTKAEARDPSSLLSKWTSIVYGASTSTGADNDPLEYAKSLQKQGFGSTYGVSEPYNQLVVYDPLKAQSFVTNRFKQLLNRQPTAQELADYSNKLIEEQKKPSSAAKTTYKDVGGVKTAIQTTGLDEQQFVDNLIKDLPEFKTVKERLDTAASQQIQAAAAANGITLTPNQLSDWTNRVANGESIDTFKSIIRDQAALGMPDQVKKLLGQGVDLESIYSPYKQTMSKVLELNPETITLDDPTLRSAISPTGELSLYDFQKALRKDPRWQYTNNAKQEVSNSVAKVLQDFGFRG